MLLPTLSARLVNGDSVYRLCFLSSPTTCGNSSGNSCSSSGYEWSLGIHSVPYPDGMAFGGQLAVVFSRGIEASLAESWGSVRWHGVSQQGEHQQKGQQQEGEIAWATVDWTRRNARDSQPFIAHLSVPRERWSLSRYSLPWSSVVPRWLCLSCLVEARGLFGCCTALDGTVKDTRHLRAPCLQSLEQPFSYEILTKEWILRTLY